MTKKQYTAELTKEEYKNLYIKTYGKKKWEEHCKSQRVLNGFNTGTKTMDRVKYSRKEKHKGLGYEV